MNTVETKNDVIPGSVYRVLLQFAMLGAEVGEIAPALEISQTLRELRSDLPHAGIVAAMCDFASGRTDQAIRSLKDILIMFPNSQLCKAMLAACLKSTDRSGWQELLESVIEDGRDEHAVGLACNFLNRSNPLVTGASPLVASRNIPRPANAIWA